MFRLLVFLAAIAVGGCGGGAEGSAAGGAGGNGGMGGQGGMPDAIVPSPTTAEIMFPPPLSAVTADTITLTGTAEDANGLVSLQVNGVDATSADGFATWQAALPLEEGQNMLVVSTEDALGEQTTNLASVQVERRLWFENLQGLDALGGDNVALLDLNLNAVILYDLATGAHRVLSAAGIPDTKSEFAFARSIQYDRDGGRLIVVDRDRPGIIAVDLNTGARTVLSENGAPAGDPEFISPTVSKFMGPQMYVMDSNRLIEVDMTNGARRLVSGPGVPDNVNPFNVAWAMTIDGRRLRALVGQRDRNNIVAVDLISGARTILSANNAPPGGPNFNAPASLAVYGDSVLSANSNRVIAADILNGTRTLFSAPPVPHLFSQALAMSLDGNRALLADRTRGRIVSVDLNDGTQAAIAGNNFPHEVEPTMVEQPYSAVAGSEGRVFYSLGDEIYAVDATTGARTKLTDFASDMVPPEDLRRILWDDAANRLLALDRDTDRIFSVDPENGDHTLLYTHTAPIDALALDSAGGRLFVADRLEQVVEVTLAGFATRTVTNRESPGYGWELPTDLAWDAARGRLIIISDRNSKVVAVDVESGVGSQIAQPNDAVPPLASLTSMAVADDALYLLGRSPAQIWHLDLSTGTPTILSDTEKGNGLRLPDSLRLDPNGQRLWVSSRSAGMIQSVSTVTGERAVTARR